MLRITTQGTDKGLVMKLEGCLAGAWVTEVWISWEAARALYGGEIEVDLRSVCHTDDAGRELMTAMYLAGARFLAAGCAMPEVVREITASAEARRRNQSCSDSQPLHSS